MVRTTRNRKAIGEAAERAGRAARQPLASKPVNFTPQKQPTTKKRAGKNTQQKEKVSKAAAPSPPHNERQTTPVAEHSSSSSRMSPDLLARSPGAPVQAAMSVRTDKRPRMIASSAVKATPSFMANFKRRARQPSILSMVQRQDLGQDDAQDESTMFSLGHSSPADRIESPTAAPFEADPAGIELPSSSPPLPQPASSRQSLSLKRKRGQNNPVRSSSRRSSQMQDSPADSPSTASPESTPPKSTRRQRGTTKPRKTRTAKQSEQVALTTAELQALLPKRRRKAPQRRQSEFDVVESDGGDRSPTPSGSEESDSDEITLYSRRKPFATKSITAANQTYGGRKRKKSSVGSADKENQTSKPAAVPASKELEDAAKKFKEIDEWELSFESQDLGGAGGSSSPWR